MAFRLLDEAIGQEGEAKHNTSRLSMIAINAVLVVTLRAKLDQLQRIHTASKEAILPIYITLNSTQQL